MKSDDDELLNIFLHSIWSRACYYLVNVQVKGSGNFVFSFIIFFKDVYRIVSLSLVVLVAEHFFIGYFLCSPHFWKLYHISLFREGLGEVVGRMLFFLELIHQLL